tara:strand:- start:177 stop:1229 length:1053 start_codon:yes stop_codon:yes gene_type:complete
MAEITAQDLLEQLSPLEKQQYEGVMGMGGFKERYEKNPDSPLVTGDINYDKFKTIADAQQQVPEKSFFNIFSSASAAEPDKKLNTSNTLNYTPDQQLLLFGDPNYLKNKSTSSYPFKSMAELAAENASLNLFPAPLNVDNPTYIAKQRMNPFFQPPLPANRLDGLPNLGIDTSFGVANEPDEEQDFLPQEKEKTGIAKLFEFLQQFSPVKGGLKILGDLLDFSDSPLYKAAPMGVYGYTPEELNKMNALGGYYSEPMRAYRRNTQSISNMLRRAAAGKSYSQKLLDKRLAEAGLGDVDTGGMIDSIKASSQTGYGGYGSREAASEAAKGGGRDYSSSPGAMAGDMEYGEE